MRQVICGFKTEELDKFAELFFTLGIGGMIINTIPDFFSLFVTRKTMLRISKSTSWAGTLWIIAYDIFQKLGIFTIWLSLGVFVHQVIEGDKVHDAAIAAALGSPLFVLIAGIGFWLESNDMGQGIYGIFLYSAFFSSLWAIVHRANLSILWNHERLEKLSKLIFWWLPFDENPIYSIGLITGLFTMLLVWLTA